MTSEPILLKKKKLKRELVRGHTITDISALISFRNCRGQIPHCTDVETESPRRHCKPRWASISYPVRHFSIIVPSSPTMVLLSMAFSYPFNHGLKLLNGKSQK